MTINKLLLVEDDLPKQRQILELIQTSIGLKSDSIKVAASISQAIELLDEHRFDCILLDMSLPTFNEKEGVARGGRQQDFGGEQILTFMDEMDMTSKVFLITQLSDFLDEDGSTVLLAALDLRLKNDFPQLYSGYAYFHHSTNKWSHDLRNFLIKEHA